MKNIAERFFSKVELIPFHECWEWVGANNGRPGYGILRVNGKNKKAHRVAWELFHGKPAPDHLDACHSCDNPGCVNPAHIWLGSTQENVLDAAQKGRLGTGNRYRTHCIRGHEFTEENTWKEKNGWRHCRKCRHKGVR